MLGGIVKCIGRVTADHVEPRHQLFGRGSRVEAFHHDGRTGRLVGFDFAFIPDRHHDEQLRIAFRQEIIQRVKNIGRQTVILVPLIDQLLAPFEHGIEESAHEPHQVRSLLDDIAAADGLDL